MLLAFFESTLIVGLLACRGSWLKILAQDNARYVVRLFRSSLTEISVYLVMWMVLSVCVSIGPMTGPEHRA